MSNDRRWKSTYRGETFIYVQVHSPPLTYVVVCFASFICHLCAFRPFTLYSPLFESQTQLQVKPHLFRFKVEQKIDLKDTLQELGIKNIFTNNADLSAMTGEA